MTSHSEPHLDTHLATRLQAFADAPLVTFDAGQVVEAVISTVPRRGTPWQLVAAATAVIALMLVAVAASGALWSDRPPPGGPPTSVEADVTPAPTPRPYAGAANEYLPQFAACLRGAGWNAVADPSGDSMRVSPVTAEQRVAFLADKLACEQEIGSAPILTPLTEAEIRARYQYLLTARQCLMDLGYDISEPPDEDAFVWTWQNTPPGLTADAPWSPYHDLPNEGPYSWEELNDLCPQVPTPSPG